MQTFLVILRATHIYSGVLWAGTVLMGALVALPRIRSMGSAGLSQYRFMTDNPRAALVFAVTSALTIVSGLLLFWLVYGFAFPWSITQWAFAMGGLSAIVSPVVGVPLAAIIGPRMPAGTSQEIREVIVAEQRVRGMAVMLTVAILLMATARYLY